MLDLEALYINLVSSSERGTFAEELAASAIGAVPVREHPLGFLVAKLSNADGIAIRLHFWPLQADENQLGFEIHNHSFDLESYIVYGEFLQTTYDKIYDCNGAWAEYRVEYTAAGESVLRKGLDRFDLEPREHMSIRAGQRYYAKGKDLHSLIRTGIGPGVSLVLTRPSSAEVVTMGPRDGPSELHSRRFEVGRTAVQELHVLGDRSS